MTVRLRDEKWDRMRKIASGKMHRINNFNILHIMPQSDPVYPALLLPRTCDQAKKLIAGLD